MDNATVQEKSFPRVSSVFDGDQTSPLSFLYSGSIRNILQKLLPPDLFFSEETSGELALKLNRIIPVLKWIEWGDHNQYVSIFLLCRHRTNGVKFFYEMISRWLLPGKRPNICSFFATDFKIPDLLDELFTICEAVIFLDNPLDKELTRHQLPILESEIYLGLISVYHANRILEIKGLSADEKTSIIQERIVSLLERRPHDFDHDIFMQMQHFLVMCSEEFKATREHVHMSRIIYIFYLFRKILKNQIEKFPNQRFIRVKLSRTYLHLPFGLKKVLGIFVAVNLQGDNEFFEERHIVTVLKNLSPKLSVVSDSFFSRSSKEEHIELLYLEVDKEDGADFSLTEMKQIKERLPEEIRNGIEKVTPLLFRPRNEEEVMRNIVILSNQLKFFRDLPQVVIAFDEQTEGELVFTVIWMRVLKSSDVSLQEMFERSASFLKFIPDRVKKVGLLRKKYPKEVTVFRIKLVASDFLRVDRSVDLFKARQAIVKELQCLLGEFRDYNGGMIAKQYEQFLALRSLFTFLNRKEELLLENFFHSIFPIELRSLFSLQFLKKLFSMLLEGIQKSREIYPDRSQTWNLDPRESSRGSSVAKGGSIGGNTTPLCDTRTAGLWCDPNSKFVTDRGIGEGDIFLTHKDSLSCYLLFTYSDPIFKERISESIRSMQIPSSQLLTLSMQVSEISYLGYIYLEENREKQERFLTGLWPLPKPSVKFNES